MSGPLDKLAEISAALAKLPEAVAAVKAHAAALNNLSVQIELARLKVEEVVARGEKALTDARDLMTRLFVRPPAGAPPS